MVILRVIGTMLHFVLKAIAIVLQAILTFIGTTIAFIGGLVTVVSDKLNSPLRDRIK